MVCESAQLVDLGLTPSVTAVVLAICRLFRAMPYPAVPARAHFTLRAALEGTTGYAGIRCAVLWGSRGREFKSRQPDTERPSGSHSTVANATSSGLNTRRCVQFVCNHVCVITFAARFTASTAAVPTRCPYTSVVIAIEEWPCDFDVIAMSAPEEIIKAV